MPLFTHGKIAAGVKASMPTLVMILLVAFPVALLICAALTPEKIVPIANRPQFKAADYWAAITKPSILRIVIADFVLTLGPGTTGPIYLFFFHDAKGFSYGEANLLLIAYIGAGILGAPLWARISQRFGKHRTIQIACVCYGITQTILMALPRVPALAAIAKKVPSHTLAQSGPTIIGMFAVGFCASAFVVLVRAMVADVVDEVKLEQKQDLTSLLYSLVTTTSKVGLAITTSVVAVVLGIVGYSGKEGVVNTPQAIHGLEMCYLFAPIILVFVGGAVFFGYKLDAKRHAEIRQALDVAAAEESLSGQFEQPPAAAE